MIGLDSVRVRVPVDPNDIPFEMEPVGTGAGYRALFPWLGVPGCLHVSWNADFPTTFWLTAHLGRALTFVHLGHTGVLEPQLAAPKDVPDLVQLALDALDWTDGRPHWVKGPPELASVDVAADIHVAEAAAQQAWTKALDQSIQRRYRPNVLKWGDHGLAVGKSRSRATFKAYDKLLHLARDKDLRQAYRPDDPAILRLEWTFNDGLSWDTLDDDWIADRVRKRMTYHGTHRARRVEMVPGSAPILDALIERFGPEKARNMYAFQSYRQRGWLDKIGIAQRTLDQYDRELTAMGIDAATDLDSVLTPRSWMLDLAAGTEVLE